jgi:heterodisulfide reductase subunit B
MAADMDKKAYALFLGCTVPARARNYELSARAVAAKAGLKLVDEPNFVCCGFPLKAMDHKASLLLSGRNLSYAEERGLDIISLCSSCTSALTEDARLLNADADLRQEINRELKKIGREYRGTVSVRHFARVLWEDVGIEHLKDTMALNLSMLKVAVHYGCHYLKPSKIYENFDQVENPETLDRMVEIAGAVSLYYRGKKKCCGGPVVASDEETALKVTRGKLDAVKEAGADLICLVCPFCAVMFDSNQKGIGERFGGDYDIPVLYLPQLLGLAMGLSRKQLGLNLNVVKTKELCERIGVEE